MPDLVTLDEVRAVCLREVSGYHPEKTKERGDKFDPKPAKLAIDTIQRRMIHLRGPHTGQCLYLEDWQRWIIGNLFGWKRANGTRRYRRSFIFVPRKNGKTPLAAAIITYMLLVDEQVGNLYGGASTQTQARLVWEWVAGFVRADPEWSAMCRSYRAAGREAVERLDNNTAYNVIPKDPESAQGWGSIACVADELHTWDSRDLLQAMIQATAVMDEPLVVEITTADYERSSVCNEEYDYADKVRSGVIKDHAFLPVLFEAPKDADWTDPEVWAIANPNLGVSVKLEYLEAECKRAQAVPALENDFRRFHLNERTQQQTRAIRKEHWDKCAEAFSEEQLVGRRCFGGLDLASKHDLACWLLLFPPTETDEKWRVLPRFFHPHEKAVEREKKDGVPYVMWARDGHLTLTEGDSIDFEYVLKQIQDDHKKFGIERIAADEWQFTFMQQRLGEIGMISHAYHQGFRMMSEPMKELLHVLIPSQKLCHPNHPVLSWCADNIEAKHHPDGHIRPVKPKAEHLRIDGIVALIMAVGISLIAEEPRPSVYESRGVIAI